MINMNLLSEIVLFQQLTPSTCRYIADNAVLAEYQSGMCLYQQGDAPSGLYALISGRVKFSRQSNDRFQILGLPTPGSCFGAESLPTGGGCPYSVTTLTKVGVIQISAELMPSLLDKYPDFQQAFLKLITERLKQFVTLVHDLAFRDVASRLAMVLISRADVEGQLTDEGIYFDRLLTQQEFAEMVGTAREVVYRTFKKFEAENIIRTTRRSILILDLQALNEIALQEAR